MASKKKGKPYPDSYFVRIAKEKNVVYEILGCPNDNFFRGGEAHDAIFVARLVMSDGKQGSPERVRFIAGYVVRFSYKSPDIISLESDVGFVRYHYPSKTGVLVFSPPRRSAK